MFPDNSEVQRFAERMRPSHNPAVWALERIRAELAHDDGRHLRPFLAALLAAFDQETGGWLSGGTGGAQ